jgi:hypothetical protein
MHGEQSEHSLAGPLVLDYHTPRPRRWPGALRILQRLGPWWPTPSLLSIALIVLLAAAVFALSRTGQNWRAGRSRVLGLRSSGLFGRSSTFIPLPRHHAIFCADPTGQLIVWRPWDDVTLLHITVTTGTVQRLAVSADESRLLAAGNSGLLLWDANGALVHQLTGGRTPYLTEADGTEPHISIAALSSDGTRLAALDFEGRLTLWDLTGPTGKCLARRQLFDSWGPYALLDFAPDDRHILAIDPNQSTWLLNANWLASSVQAKRSYFGGSISKWMDGGRRLVSAEGPFNGSNVCVLTIRDCDTGEFHAEWPLQAILPSAVRVSEDDHHIAVASSFFNQGACVDLTTTPPTLRQRLPLEFGDWGDMQFFADNRRAVVSSWESGHPAIVDLVTGRHLGTLPIPPPPSGGVWNPYPPTLELMISPDDQHIAARLGNGSVQMFDRVGPDSAWGAAGSPIFLLVAVLLAMLLVSLWRDAVRGSVFPSTAGRHRVSAGMVILSWPALLFLCGSTAVWFAPDADHHWYWWNRHWLVVMFALWLPAGLGVRGVSPLWNALAKLLLFVCAGICVLMALGAHAYCSQPFILLDRVVMLPAVPVATLCVAGAITSTMLLRQHGRPSPTPV